MFIYAYKIHSFNGEVRGHKIAYLQRNGLFVYVTHYQLKIIPPRSFAIYNIIGKATYTKVYYIIIFIYTRMMYEYIAGDALTSFKLKFN